MTSIETLTLDVADPAAAKDFYAAAFWLDTPLRFRTAAAPTTTAPPSRSRPRS